MSPAILEHDWFPRPIPENVYLGERSWLYSAFAFLHYQSRRPCGVRIGHDTGLYAGTFFELGPDAEVEIGNYCTIVGAIIATDRRISVGDYALIAHEVVIADSGIVQPERPVSSSPKDPELSIVIGENVWIGAGAMLLAGAKIGRGAIVGAATLVDFEVPEYAIVAGNPAKICGWANRKK